MPSPLPLPSSQPASTRIKIKPRRAARAIQRYRTSVRFSVSMSSMIAPSVTSGGDYMAIATRPPRPRGVGWSCETGSRPVSPTGDSRLRLPSQPMCLRRSDAPVECPRGQPPADARTNGTDRRRHRAGEPARSAGTGLSRRPSLRYAGGLPRRSRSTFRRSHQKGKRESSFEAFAIPRACSEPGAARPCKETAGRAFASLILVAAPAPRVAAIARSRSHVASAPARRAEFRMR